jgi:hypothetical protein
VLELADPAYHVWANVFFYEFFAHIDTTHRLSRPRFATLEQGWASALDSQFSARDRVKPTAADGQLAVDGGSSC